MKQKRINIPIYYGSLLIIDNTTKEYTKEIETKYNCETTDGYSAFVFENNKVKHFQLIVVITTLDPSVIAHESVHLTNKIFNNVGQELDSYNDEAQAYLTGWLFDKIYKFINKK